jgi:DNA-binding Xre family transcriptional regulator
MDERGVSKSRLSKEIGISDKGLERILKDGLPFKMKQIQNICGLLQIHSKEIGQYFFNTKFDQNTQKSTMKPEEKHRRQ